MDREPWSIRRQFTKAAQSMGAASTGLAAASAMTKGGGDQRPGVNDQHLVASEPLSQQLIGIGGVPL
jgi:hypothetical protein